MKITELKPTKRDGRVNVYLDGEYSFTVYEEIILDYSLFVDSEIDENSIQEILLLDNRKFAKRKAFDILGRGAVTVSTMRKKLREKSICNEVIDETVDYLIQNNYLNDYDYAENAVSFLHETKFYGKNRILQIFFEKGVPKDIAEEVCEAYFQDAETPDLLRDMLIEYLRKIDVTEINSKKRLIDKFLRMGYSYSEIKNTLSDIKNIDLDDD